jgi:hypothetical protein
MTTIVSMTPYARERLAEEVPKLVEIYLDNLVAKRCLDLNGQRERVVQAATAHLMDGADVEALAADVARVILDEAQSPNHADLLLDLVLLHRLEAGLEEGLPAHVAQAIMGFHRVTRRQRRRRRW